MRGANDGGRPRRASAEKTRDGAAPQIDAGALSDLSFEERMAVYKKKYGSRGPGAEAGKARSEKGPKSQGERKAAGGERAGDSAGKGRRPRGRKGGGQGAAQKTESAARSARTPEQAAPEKKGILSRIFGAFKKKG